MTPCAAPDAVTTRARRVGPHHPAPESGWRTDEQGAARAVTDAYLLAKW